MSLETHLIGVHHEGKEIAQRVIDYVDETHPNLENIMIELPEDWHNLAEVGEGFFIDLGLHYEQKGVKVIPGDRLYHQVLDQRDNLKEIEELKAMDSGNKKITMALYLLAKYSLTVPIKPLKIIHAGVTGKLIKNRNIDMDALLQEEKPEVVVLGGLHTKYLKKQHPELKHTHIGSYDLLDQIVKKVLLRNIDEDILVKEYSPLKSREYQKKFLKLLINAGVIAGGNCFLGEMGQTVTTMVGTYGMISNLGGTVNYGRYQLGQLKEKISQTKTSS
jgi:hypothetical protein